MEKVLIRVPATTANLGPGFDCLGGAFELYNTFWLYAGLNDYFKIIRTMFLDIFVILVIFFFMPNTYDARMIFLAGVFSTIFITGSRVSVRILAIYISHYYSKLHKLKKKNLLIVGAGSAAKIIINDIKTTNSSVYNIVGLIDDDSSKIGCFVSGCQVLGNRNLYPE